MKKQIIKRAIILLISMPIFVAISILSMMQFYSVFYEEHDVSKLITAVHDHYSVVLISTAGLNALMTMLMIRRPLDREAEKTDSRGISILPKGTKGSARWLKKGEIEKVFKVTDIRNTCETVFGMLDYKGRKTVSYRDLGRGNRHFIVLGNSGAGKSYTFVRTELIQSVLRNESFVATDASGELYVTLAEFCRNRGYKVKVLNLHYPKHSMGWNCAKEVLSSETERLDGTKLADFTSIFMNNTKNGNENTFWFDGASNLFKAVLGGIAYRRETQIIQGLKKIVCEAITVNGMDKDRELILENCHLLVDENNYPSIKDIKKQVREWLKEMGYHSKDIIRSFENIERNSKPLTISEVLKVLLSDVTDIHQWERSFSDIPYGHPAAIAFSIFDNPSVKDEIKASTQNGLCSRLNILSDGDLRIALSHDDIVLEDFNREKTACFVIFNNKVNTMQPVMSLFFGFMFNDCAAAYEREEAEEKTTGKKNSRIPITVMMDEFYSIGYIDNFVNFITNSRKSHINISIILQYSRQLYELYGNNDGTGIMSNCEVAILLNCNDRETAEYFSSFMTGMATVISTSHQSRETLLGRMMNSGNANVTEQGRSLMTLDEFRTMSQEDCLVIRRGNYPVKLHAFPYVFHPVYSAGELVESSPFEINALMAVEDRSFGKLTVADMKNNTVAEHTGINDSTSKIMTKHQRDKTGEEVTYNGDLIKKKKNDVRRELY